MGRFVEAALFIVPFAAFLAWRIAERRGGAPARWSVAAVWCGIALAIVALLLLTREGLQPGDAYVPATLEGGQISPGRREVPPMRNPP